MADNTENSKPGSFWGNALGIAAAIGGIHVTLVAGTLAGAASALNGGGFEDGYDKVFGVYENVVDKAAKFGDDHNKQLTDNAIGIASSVVARVILNGDRGGHHTA